MPTGELQEKYGARWPADASPLEIEMACIQLGGTWQTSVSATNLELVQCGNGLPYHYEAMRKILWPHLDEHRWHTLCRDEILRNKITVLMGPGSCGKTHEAAWIYLCEYFCFPHETCVLVSSTEIRGLRARIWAEITSLWQQAVDKFPNLPGHLLDSRLVLCTDALEKGNDKKVRDIRRGFIGIPCVQNGKFVGLGKYCGIKQKRMRLIADEAQFMYTSFLSAFANLNKNVDFRACVLGNPADTLDALGLAAEPQDGWTNHLEPGKTTVWKTKFLSGTCVNLIGTDSPNFDYPEDQPTKYPYLISREKIAETLSFFPKDSVEYYSQCIGSMKIGTLSKRVITRDLCKQFQALENVTWHGTTLTKIYALDAAYGGDRCVGGPVEFGLDINGKLILSVHKPTIIPIRVGGGEPEDQIAKFVQDHCTTLGIPPENMFHDATGRGSLGTALARAWSAQTNPVEFGGKPSERPVSLDLFVYDPQLRTRRLKLCSEHYSKFVTELWFSVRYTIESGQLRNLPEDVMEEGCRREWRQVKGDKIELETKEEMKERTRYSPDLFDWLSIAVEGARRRGFNIGKLANEESESDLSYLDDLRRQAQALQDSHQLNYAA